MSDQKMHFLSWMWHIFHSQKTVDIWCKYDTHERITNSSPIATGSSHASRQVVPPPLEVFWRKVLRAISSCEAPPRYVQSCEAQQVCTIWPKGPRGSFDQKCCMRSYHGRSHRQLYIVNWKSLGLKLQRGPPDSFFHCSDQTNQLVIIICLIIWSGL